MLRELADSFSLLLDSGNEVVDGATAFRDNVSNRESEVKVEGDQIGSVEFDSKEQQSLSTESNEMDVVSPLESVTPPLSQIQPTKANEIVTATADGTDEEQESELSEEPLLDEKISPNKIMEELGQADENQNESVDFGMDQLEPTATS